jgi:hypothetical protein
LKIFNYYTRSCLYWRNRDLNPNTCDANIGYCQLYYFPF